MIDLKLATAFIGWTVTTFVAHYSVKRILLAAAPGGAEVRKSYICICFAFCICICLDLHLHLLVGQR